MEILCVDDKFPKDYLEFYAKYGVVTPTEGTMYTIREVVNMASIGAKGLLLEELKNPKVPMIHPIMGETMYEPNWHVNRFTTLLGDLINVREVEKELSKKLI